MNILFSQAETLTLVQKFIGHTADEKEFVVYAEWDIDDGWLIHGVMFTDMNYNETEEEVEEINSFFYKNIIKP